MNPSAQILEDVVNAEYRHGFVTDIEAESAPPGLNEDIIRFISQKKDEPEFLLAWRLKAYRHWLTMQEPTWPKVRHPSIDYQKIIYYSAPKQKGDGPKSLDEVDPKLLEAYSKLGISLSEQERLAGVAVDAVFDSVSVATTFKAQLAKHGIIFCSFSEAVREFPELVRKYLGSVVPYTDNFFASLNSAVFSDGSFCYIPGTKMIHLGKNSHSTIISKGISAGHGQNSYRGLVQIGKNAANARNYSQCDSLLLGGQCGAHTFPYIAVKNSSSRVEHEASTSKIGDDQIFYCNQRGISTQDAVNMIVNGFCKEVFQKLPMEFAVEAQKLLGVSLEGSVG